MSSAPAHSPGKRISSLSAQTQIYDPESSRSGNGKRKSRERYSDDQRSSVHLRDPGQRASTGTGVTAIYAPPQDSTSFSESTEPSPVKSREVPEEAEGRDSYLGGESSTAWRRPEVSSSGRARRPSRGTHRSLQDQEGDLTELAAPRPVPDDSERNRREPYLEEAEQSFDEARPPSFRPPSKKGTKDTARRGRPSELATQLYTISYLIFFSIFGTLARLGVQWLTFYPGAPVVTPVLWANVGGSFFMGFLSEDRQLFRDEWGLSPREHAARERAIEEEKVDLSAVKKQHSKVKKTIPLFVGLATGFCGSFTSFSSFERDVFLALSNDLSSPISHPYAPPTPSFSSTIHRNGGYSLLALLSILLTTLALSLSALYVGAHFALALDKHTPTLPFRLTRRVIDPLFLVLGPGVWLGAILLAIFPPDRSTSSTETWRGTVLFALVFAPLGCLARFYASLKLNALVPSFPLGTFAVNVFGCAVEAMCYDLQHVRLESIKGMQVGGGVTGCQVLQGVMDGFCGCLTTVSTFVNEVAGLRRRHAYVYGVGSVGVGLGVMVVVMGSVRWGVGWSETSCVTMRTSN